MEVPQRGSGAALRWGPKADDIFSILYINISSTGALDNILSTKSTLQHF